MLNEDTFFRITELSGGLIDFLCNESGNVMVRMFHFSNIFIHFATEKRQGQTLNRDERYFRLEKGTGTLCLGLAQK